MENTRIGPFQVLNRIGSSRRQKVFRAIQVDQGREVALKFIKLPPNVAESKAISRIQRETKILTKLVHPNLVRVYGAGVEQTNIFFAMELVHGEVLSKVLTRRGKLAWDLAVEYAKQIAKLLEYIHGEEVIHLKLTPDKVIVQDDGLIRVTDLRLNRSKKRRWDTSKSSKKLDSAAYLSPEQLVGQAGTNKSDFYSLGVILYEMVTGKLPYSQPTMTLLIKAKQTETPPHISEYTLDCPVWLEQIIMHLLHIDPARRPHSARAIVLALEEIQAIDSSGTGVAEKLTGTFNPLTMGVDKSEARKLLGYKTESVPRIPFYKKTWAQITGLVLSLFVIAIFLGYMLRPPSDAELYGSARQLEMSNNPDDWTTAKMQYIEPLLTRGEGDFFDDAENLISQIEFKRLRKRLEDGNRSRNTDTLQEKKLFSAREYINEGNYPRALAIVKQLLGEVGLRGKQRHVWMLADAMEIEINIEMDRARLASGKTKTDEEAAVTTEVSADAKSDESASGKSQATTGKDDSKDKKELKSVDEPNLKTEKSDATARQSDSASEKASD